MLRKGRAKKVERFISPHITEVHDAYGMEGKLNYEKPVSHDTVVIIAAILASHDELLAKQKGILDAIDDQKEHLQKQTNLLNQIQQNQRSG